MSDHSTTGSGGTPSRPKIFLVAEGSSPWVGGYALAEDGTWLTSHVSSSRAFARADLQASAKLALYAAHYPRGYEIVDYTKDTGDELQHRADYMAALMRSDILPAADPIRLRESAA